MPTAIREKMTEFRVDIIDVPGTRVFYSDRIDLDVVLLACDGHPNAQVALLEAVNNDLWRDGFFPVSYSDILRVHTNTVCMETLEQTS